MNNKRLILIALSIIVIAFFFWTGSRYPQLNEKAMMGGDTPIEGISFDVVEEIRGDDSQAVKIYKNTINWIDTNKKGMTFGLFFAASLILLFKNISKRQSDNKWLNSGLGLIIGAPLGVCVNCATPIAKGMADAGSKIETSLATLISSPTFNVIALSMLLSLLPDYMIAIKIMSTLVLILLFIPLIVKYFSPPVVTQPSTMGEISEVKFPFETSEKFGGKSWGHSILWFGHNYLRSFWFIFRTAVPLMLLAGLLGNILVTIVPLGTVVDFVQVNSPLLTIFVILCVALIGTFLPVPITFDIIAVVILMSLGLAPMYSMILLFTLGTFSIYPYLIIHKNISKKIANALLISVIGLGIVSGLVAQYFADRSASKQEDIITSIQEEMNDSKGASILWTIQTHSAREQGTFKAATPLADTLTQNVIQIPFNKNTGTKDQGFIKYDGTNIGIDLPYSYNSMNTISPLNNPRSIASGDINRDLLPDLVCVSNDSVYTFLNTGEHKFFKSGPLNTKGIVLNAALGDLNSDGYVDMALSIFRDGAYIIYNENGNFDFNKAIRLPTSFTPVLTASFSFGDLDKNGELDIFLGNWNNTFGAKFVMDESINEGFLQKNGSFERFDVGTLGGQSHSTLISDLDLDGNPDIIEGNDFQFTDEYHFGKGDGQFTLVTAADNIFQRTTQTTMSVISGDVDNDLDPDIYIAQIFTQGAPATKSIEETCSCINSEIDKENCFKILQHRRQINIALSKNDFQLCPDYDKIGCMSRFAWRNQMRSIGKKNLKVNNNVEYPDLPFYEDYLEKFNPEEHRVVKQEKLNKGKIKQRTLHAILHKNEGNKKFKEVAKEAGVNKTGWAWNAKFSDLNNDEYLDLLVVNGFLFGTNPLQSNIMYYNNGDGSFTDQTADLGFTNYLPTIGYTYSDFDMDGDIDIIMAPSIGPLIIYENQNQSNYQSITIELEDEIGNRRGIGSKVYIEYGDGKKQYREILNSGGFKSVDEPVAHFGLRNDTKIHKVEVWWSTGERSAITSELQAGYKYIIRRLPS